MSAHIAPPFRCDHIGSLKRPLDLLAKRAEFDEGKVTREELRQVEDVAIKAEVERQRRAGIKSFTDGEFRRHMFWDGFHNNLDGMTVIPNPPRDIFKMYVPDIKAFFDSPAAKPGDTMVCSGKLVRNKPMYRPEFEYMKSIVKPDEVKNIKLTLAAPEWYHLRHGEHARNHSVYPDEAEYFADLAKAYREELADLYEAGCRNVQFDDPLLAYFCSEAMLEGMKAEGTESEPILDAYIKLYNDCVRDVPDDMITGIHLCRGNFKDGHHFSEGGYDRIAVKLFNELNVNTYYLEYDTERAGGFEPLAHLPKNKSAVLGLVTSKFPQLEKEEDLIKRINQAADYMAKGTGESREEALNRLCLSPQCGFASHSEGNAVSFDDVISKLSLCHETAKKVWSDA
ncbi:hypothetical protein JCM11491_004641 [Sporobolomyces phaffii]